MEYHPAVKMNDTDLHVSSWINIQYIVLSKSQAASYTTYIKFKNV